MSVNDPYASLNKYIVQNAANFTANGIDYKTMLGLPQHALYGKVSR